MNVNTMNRVEAKALGAHCGACPNNKGQLVSSAPPSGKISLVIVGEHPTRVDEKMNAPFSGAPGHFLDDRLRRDAKLSRSSTYVTNAALCRGDSDDDNERAAECCAPRLLKELAATDEGVPIVALGKASLRSILGVRNILTARGFIWTVAEIEESRIKAAYKNKADGILKGATLRARQVLFGRLVLPSIAPSFVLRADTWKPISELDFRRIGRVVHGEVRAPYEDQVEYTVGGPEVLEGLGDTVSCDIETTGIKPLETNILSIGFADKDGHVSEIWPWSDAYAKRVSNAMRHRMAVVFHNGNNFDLLVLENHGVSW
jgi:uracil-DNA glycosylase family 4